MSHHLDSPEARSDPRLNIADLYVFPGEIGTVFAITTCPSLAGEDAPHGFHPEGRYEFRIDGDGDLVPDVTYRVTFGEADSGGQQTVEVRSLTGAQAADAAAEGTVILNGTTSSTASGEKGVRLWAGQAHDPFYLDGRVLGAVGNAFAEGTTVDLSGWNQAQAANEPFRADKVYSLVLEVPDTQLRDATGAGDLRVWALASLATDSGGWHPVNRVGIPMIQPIFAQHDDNLAAELNSGEPADDLDRFKTRIADATAAVVAAYGTARHPQAYGRSVAERIFPNALPYTLGTPAAFSFATWNGRSLTDNACDVMFSLATNTAFTSGLTKDSVPTPPTGTFPYVRPVVAS
ncbi:DUF4331 family protein [Streptomyces sp. NPDC095817]|uniref:DUF4331 family protein n=1 Tax=Streptomyces sp. NPDC095817 TaxID=3155082 RepID=UPI003318170C